MPHASPGSLLPAWDGPTADPVVWWWLGLGTFGIWLALAVVLVVATVPKLPRSGPATTVPGPEAPAIASLLVHRWRVTSHAAAATLVDLAARRHLDIERIGDGTMLLRVRSVAATRGDVLAPWEHEVLSLVHQRAVHDELPLPALLEGADPAWFERFRRVVEREAMAAGLARRRWSRWMGAAAALGLAAASLPALVGADLWIEQHRTAADTSSDGRDWIALVTVAVVLAVGVTSSVGSRLRGLGHTAAGRRACAHWLGVRQAYHEHTSFESIDADGVVVWDRHLSYACALGAAPEVARSFPLGPQDDDEAWSPATGLWREVGVVVPRRRAEGLAPQYAVGHGALAVSAVAVAAVAVAWLVRVVAGTSLVDDLRDQPAWTFRTAAVLAAVVLGLPAVWALVVLWRWVPALAAGIADRGTSRVLEGVVVKHRTREFGRDRRRIVVRYVAVDDGTSDRVRALRWDGAMPPLYQRVRVEHTPRLRHVWSITALEPARRR